MIRINKVLNLNLDVSKLEKLNSSKHEKFNNYFKNNLFRRIINKKIKKDLAFYNKIKGKNKKNINV